LNGNKAAERSDSSVELVELPTRWEIDDGNPYPDRHLQFPLQDLSPLAGKLLNGNNTEDNADE